MHHRAIDFCILVLYICVALLNHFVFWIQFLLDSLSRISPFPTSSETALIETRDLHAAEAGGDSQSSSYSSVIFDTVIHSLLCETVFKFASGHYTLLFSFASLSSGSFAGCSSQSGVSQISVLALFCFVFTLPPGCSFLGYCFKYQIYAGKSQICISSPDLLTGLQTCISSLQ